MEQAASFRAIAVCSGLILAALSMLLRSDSLSIDFQQGHLGSVHVNLLTPALSRVHGEKRNP